MDLRPRLSFAGGEACAIKKDKFSDFMRLCFCWLTRAQIEEGVEYLRQ